MSFQTFSTLETDPIRNFRFIAEFLPLDTTANAKSNFPAIGFAAVSGLSIATEAIAYREGGYNTTVHQIPGMTTFTPVTFSRGMVLKNGSTHMDWMRTLFSTVAGKANPSRGLGHNFRCNIDLSVLSHPNPAAETKTSDTTPGATISELHVAMRFRIYNAWINQLSYSDLVAGANDLLVENMQIVHEGWDVIYAKDLNETAANFVI